MAQPPFRAAKTAKGISKSDAQNGTAAVNEDIRGVIAKMLATATPHFNLSAA